MLTNLRINADVGVSFSWFIFNLQRRQIYAVLYSNIQCRLFNMWRFQMQKPLTGGGAFSGRVRTSLHSRPMLRINCPVSHKPLTSPLPQALPFKPIYPHMWCNLNWQKMTLAHWEFSWSYTCSTMANRQNERRVVYSTSVHSEYILENSLLG